MYLNYRSHSFMEQKIDVALLSSLYSTQLIAKGDRNLLDQNRTYYKLLSKIIEEGHVRNQISREKSIQEIADELYLSRRTCQRYIASIYEKAGVKSRMGLYQLYIKTQYRQ